jgi:GNAT superfamily N-acetyltransferase
MEIRTIASAELPQLLQLYRHLHASDDPLPDEKTVQAIWSGLLANPACTYLGVFIAEQLVASCTMTVIPNLTRGCRPYGLIENVVTHADHRQKGLGKAVLAAMVARAWDAHCYKVMLMTGRKDAAILDFYRGAGFDGDAKRAFTAYPPASGKTSGP